jgi:hypothetical protein
LNADESSRTSVGQNSTQNPQPLHRSTVMVTKPLAIFASVVRLEEQSVGQINVVKSSTHVDYCNSATVVALPCYTSVRIRLWFDGPAVRA